MQNGGHEIRLCSHLNWRPEPGAADRRVDYIRHSYTVFKDDGLSGATAKRPALLRCLKKLEHGDLLTLWKLDRLGRSLRDLVTMLDDLKKLGVKFRSLTEPIDTETSTRRPCGQMIGVLAELKRSLVSERTRAGAIVDKARGVKFGRKRKLTPPSRSTLPGSYWEKNPPSRNEVASLYYFDRTTLYRALF